MTVLCCFVINFSAPQAKIFQFTNVSLSNVFYFQSVLRQFKIRPHDCIVRSCSIRNRISEKHTKKSALTKISFMLITPRAARFFELRFSGSDVDSRSFSGAARRPRKFYTLFVLCVIFMKVLEQIETLLQQIGILFLEPKSHILGFQKILYYRKNLMLCRFFESHNIRILRL